MDQPTAKKLLKHGAIFLFLDVPEGTEFGIDLKSWNTGEKFRGVKMIPPGIHYVFYNSVSSTGDTAPRVGFFHNFKSGEVLARKWDKINEDMSMDVVPQSEISVLMDNIRMLDQFLGPYPFEILQRWKQLTSHLNENLLYNLMPLSGKIRSALELVSCKDCDRPKGNKIIEDGPSTSKRRSTRIDCDELLDNLLPDMKPIAGTEIRFTPIPSKRYPDGSSPSEITKHCMDQSYILDVLLEDSITDMDLLGEMQFSYICFLVGHSMEAFQQWKQIICLVCSCEDIIVKYQSMYEEFLSILEMHVKEIPEEFLADICSNNNFVYVKLRQLFGYIIMPRVSQKLKNKVDRLIKMLSKNYDWDFSHLESEDEDDAPVVVELGDCTY
ncbi:protein AAR2 homolog [Onthophagus taurus]|uniref:protein AAR2 homolog n=1 Tax=Onthophagus taurus TaxID=166361 RepID=UPI000C1FFD36|nr:protein AAR2 homolog [Onthophagus taurus]